MFSPCRYYLQLYMVDFAKKDARGAPAAKSPQNCPMSEKYHQRNMEKCKEKGAGNPTPCLYTAKKRNRADSSPTD